MKTEQTKEYWIERAREDFAREDYDSDAEYESVIEEVAERDLAEAVAEAEKEAREHVWDYAKNLLHDAGLFCCGCSGKSASTYFGRGRDSDGRERIRLSDHAVAHACSDCAVCVEIGDGSPDADVTISETADDAEIETKITEALRLFAERCPESAPCP
jgi:hypothetical protein